MASVNRLLIIGTTQVRANLLEEEGLTQFVKGKPLPVSPLAWELESGLSHYGYELSGLKLKDLKTLEDFAAKYERATVLPYDKKVDQNGKPLNPVQYESTEELLGRRGLRINELALEETE